MAGKKQARRILENRKVILGLYLFVTVTCLSWFVLFTYRSRIVPVASPTKTSPPVTTEAAEDRETVSPAAKVSPKSRGKLALVIDDVGYRGSNLRAFLEFPGALTISILPGLPGSAEAAVRGSEAGKELLLHLPMEALNKQDPGPGAILVRMKDERIRALVRQHMAELPGIVGVNNHMGSLATQNERVMKIVLEEIKKKNLFFLDSGTVAGSVGKKTAEIVGVPFLERTVFLDNERSKTAIREAISRGKAIAEKRGHAVMIGHVWCAELAEVLIEVYPELLDEGFSFYNLSEILKGEASDDDSWD